MNVYIQETDSKIRFSLPSNGGHFFSAWQRDETLDRLSVSPFLPLRRERNLTNEALKALRQIENKEVAKKAEKILFYFQETVAVFQHFGYDAGHLPQLHAFNIDDGSVLIEWIFNDFRIGFSIEPALQESSWYLVANSSLGETSASGYIWERETKSLILWLMSFAISHS